MGSSDISAIFFDLGGVALKHAKTIAPSILAQVYSIPLTEAEDAYREVRDSWQTGQITGREVLQRLKSRYKSDDSLDKLEEVYMSVYREISVVDEAMMRLIQTLRVRFTAAALSNMVDFHLRFNEARHLFDHFDKVYISTKVGFAKPDNKFFRYALNDLHKTATESLFIDDKEKNVIAAHDVGMMGYLYTGVDALQTYLTGIGLLMR